MIFAIMPMADDGCSHYRINKPYKALLKQGHEVVFIEKEMIESVEALDLFERADYIVCRSYHAGSIKILDSFLKKKVKVIVDMDDDMFNIDPYSEAYRYFGTKEVKHNNEWLWKDGETLFIDENIKKIENLKEFLKRADIITVTTERLRQQMLEFNKNVIVSFNGIDGDWIVPNFREHSDIRIGWTGGASHYKDWVMVQQDIERIMNEYPRAKLVIAGELFEGIFKNISKDRLEHWHWINPTGHSYRTAMMDLDLAIVPLEDSKFNANKSSLKFYEFSSLKIPTICSNVAPYKDDVPKESLTDNFYETLKYLIKNPDIAKEIAERNYQWVIKNRNQENISKDLIKNIC